jgi:tetratricopeptide (TPR) repeat protein
LVRHTRPEEAIAALNRSLAIAERRGDVLHQIDLLSMMQTFHLRAANYEATLACARRASALSETIDDPATTVLAHSLLGVALHHIGDLRGSRAEHEAALRQHGPHSRSAVKYHSYNGPNLARNYLARTLCLLGYPVQARELARQAVENAEREGHPVTLTISLLWAVTVCLWSGDLQGTERYVDKVISNAATHFLSHFQAVGDGFKAVLKVRRGEAAAGVTSLQSYFADLAAAPNDFVAKEFIIALVQGLMATGRSAEGLALIDTTLLPVGTNVDALYMPELLRVKASVLLSMPEPRVDEGKAHLRQSLELSRQLGARAWELRAATDLAALLAEQGRFEEGRTLLQSVFAQFTEGRETPDLQAAERLLAALAVTNS